MSTRHIFIARTGAIEARALPPGIAANFLFKKTPAAAFLGTVRGRFFVFHFCSFCPEVTAGPGWLFFRICVRLRRRPRGLSSGTIR